MNPESSSTGLTPEQQANVAHKEIEKLAADLPAKIANDTELAVANELLVRIRTTAKNVKAQKDPVIKSLNEQVKTIRSWFKPFEDKSEKLEQALKASILEYQLAVQRRAERAAARIEKKVDAGEMSVSEGMGKISQVKQPEAVTRSETGSTQVRTVQKVRITDASALPPKYFLRARVLEALRLEVQEDVLRSKLPVPSGAEVYEEKGLAISTHA